MITYISSAATTATRTDRITGRQYTVDIELGRREGPHGTIIEITKGDVTGYESFYLDSWIKHKNTSWCACAGTKGVWDRLEISAEEMQRALKALVFTQ